MLPARRAPARWRKQGCDPSDRATAQRSAGWTFLLRVANAGIAFGSQILLARWWMARFSMGPVEWLWRHLKEVEMRNLACGDLEELHLELHLALGRVRQKPRLSESFFEGAGLGL